MALALLVLISNFKFMTEEIKTTENVEPVVTSATVNETVATGNVAVAQERSERGAPRGARGGAASTSARVGVNDEATYRTIGGKKATASPGGGARPACDYSKKQRGDGAGRPIA